MSKAGKARAAERKAIREKSKLTVVEGDKSDTPVQIGEVAEAAAAAAEATTPVDISAVKKPRAKRGEGKRKLSKAAVAYFANHQTAFPLNAVITVSPEALAKNPKSRIAAERFSLYKTGQTVGEYIALSGEKYGKAQAERDTRWDAMKGWITVAVPTPA